MGIENLFGGGYGDDLLARESRMRGESIGNRPPQRQPTSMAGQYPFLPASQNIEDRRGEYGNMGALIGYLTGLMPNQWSQIMGSPLTALPGLGPWSPPSLPPTTTDPLSSSAGYNDIGQLMELLKRPPNGN